MGWYAVDFDMSTPEGEASADWLTRPNFFGHGARVRSTQKRGEFAVFIFEVVHPTDWPIANIGKWPDVVPPGAQPEDTVQRPDPTPSGTDVLGEIGHGVRRTVGTAGTLLVFGAVVLVFGLAALAVRDRRALA